MALKLFWRREDYDRVRERWGKIRDFTHPRVVPVREVGEWDGRCGMVSDYRPMLPLHKLLERGGLEYLEV
ncbi:MAG: hypothetical protein AABY80_03640, partial [Candidatus Deferrimicrobiota bacterium]